LMPAHVGEAIGFDTGFSDPVTDLVSGGPYMVADVEPGYSLELVRNARYWAGAGDLAAITYYFTTGAPQTFDALSTGELDVASLQVPASSFGQLQSTAGLSADVVASSQYEDLDFNEKAGPLRSAVLREAVMMAVDRAAMATAVLGPYGLAAKPVDNRVLLAGSPGYVPEGAAYDEPRPAEALQLLAAHGYTRHSEGLVGPKGIPVHLSLYVSSADLVAQDLAAKVVSSCAGIGISVSVVPGTVAAGDVAGTERAVAPPTGWEMAIELRQIPTFPSGIGSTYATGGQADVDGYSSGSMNLLLARASRAPGTELPAVYDKLDALAWKDAVDLPLVAVPVIVALDTQLLNVQPGPWPDAIAWNEEDWGFAAP
jgi:peptide/nickel transport system substrate-binding protein